jgi:tRNA1Val (adenine37-N6)-methyltransferase
MQKNQALINKGDKMGAPFFSFKQFTVYHDKCAMKVGTDGVLLGAWADVSSAKTILDVGTGSGLIALMLAQRCEAMITAIDVETSAVEQANFNVANSPWANRITNIEISLSEYVERPNVLFDLIVSNPPFFKASLTNPDKKRTIARHAELDFHNELILSAKKMLTSNGRICLILPVAEGNECIRFASEQSLFLTKKVQVYPKLSAPVKRLLLEFSISETSLIESDLVIESDSRHQYSDQFVQLVEDFYLKL